jgi:thiol-disulfide isomerase/thioredoxin
MKIEIVNEINLKDLNDFERKASNKTMFAKYFSPTCPACIKVKDDWDNMCKELENDYEGDIMVANIDPEAMDNLKTVYHDIQYVPRIAIIKNGKLEEEYNKEITKEDLIQFLMEKGLIHKRDISQSGGGIRKRIKRKTKKNRKNKKSRKHTRKQKTRKNHKKNKNLRKSNNRKYKK